MAVANGRKTAEEMKQALQEADKIQVTHNVVGEIWDWPLQHNEGVVKVINTSEKFEVGLDVQYFTPNEIEIKVCGGELVIHCRHEFREDSHGRVAREIHRAYKLPEDVDGKSVKSHLNNRGILQITGEKMHSHDAPVRAAGL